MARPEAYKPLPSQERLKELLAYNEETGVMTWKSRDENSFVPMDSRSAADRAGLWNVLRAGKVAGTISAKTGYTVVVVDREHYKAHRVIWKMIHGNDPSTIDHINGNRSDNRLENLCDTSGQMNAKNKRLYANNTSGMMGVSLHKRDGVWQAKINVEPSVELHLGSFETRAEAVAARIAGEILLSYHENHGAPDRARHQETPRKARTN